MFSQTALKLPTRMDERDVPDAFSFDIVLKVAERCNLACKYCYYYFQKYDGNKNTPFMSREVVDELPRYLARSLDDLNIAGFNVVLHGGEPLLMKKYDFDYLCTRIREGLAGKVEVQFAIQTNGVLIDNEWIDIFHKHKISVGVSIDGPQHLHDQCRRDHTGRGSYDGAVRGLRLLQAAAKEGRLTCIGALCVLPVSDDSETILAHLVKDLGVNHPNLNFPHDGWDSEEAIAWNEAVHSHRKVVRFALKYLLNPFHYVKGITNVLLSLKSEKGARYNDQRVAHRHHIATVSSNGAVFVDDNMLGVDASLSTSTLSIFNGSLRDLVESQAWQRMNDAIDQVPVECEGCEWYRTCRSGDLFNRFSAKEGLSRKSVLCETLKMIHMEAASYLVKNNMVTIEELADRLSRKPTITAQDSLRMLMSKR
jgi:uncharacterized protein